MLSDRMQWPAIHRGARTASLALRVPGTPRDALLKPTGSDKLPSGPRGKSLRLFREPQGALRVLKNYQGFELPTRLVPSLRMGFHNSFTRFFWQEVGSLKGFVQAQPTVGTMFDLHPERVSGGTRWAFTLSDEGIICLKYFGPCV